MIDSATYLILILQANTNMIMRRSAMIVLAAMKQFCPEAPFSRNFISSAIINMHLKVSQLN